MPRNGWRFFATRLNGDGTETMLDPSLPLSSPSGEKVLSGDSSWSATISPAYARLIGADGQPIIKAWSTAIYAEREGQIRAAGIVTDAAPTGHELSLNMTSWTGYARGLPYTGNGYYGVAVETMDVVRIIWTHIQSQNGGNIGLQLGPGVSGYKIGTELEIVDFTTSSGEQVTFEAGPVKLTWYGTTDLMGKVDELASGAQISPSPKVNIFDYAEEHFWDGDNIKHVLNFGFPRIGTKRDDLRFVSGVNLWVAPTVALSGDEMATGVMVLGNGDGSEMKHSLLEPGRQPGDPLRRIVVVQDSSLKTLAACEQTGSRELAWRRNSDDIESIVVRDHDYAPLGAVGLGDVITLEIKDDWKSTMVTVRVLAISWSSDDDTATYKVARTDKLIN